MANLYEDVTRYLTRAVEREETEMKRLAFVRTLFEEVLPRFPRTLSDHFELEAVITGWEEPERSLYWLRLRTKPNIPQEDVPQAFGTIIKVSAALFGMGWQIKPEPKIEPSALRTYTKDATGALDVAVEGTRDGVRLIVEFQHLPESERCKLVEEQVLVPERYETKLRVVCEGDPVRLQTGHQIESGEEVPA